MRLISTRIIGFGPHDDITINWSDYGTLPVLEAPNGAGKTFIIEASLAALYNDFPTYHGNIYAALKQGGTGNGEIILDFEHESVQYQVVRKVKTTARTQSNSAVIKRHEGDIGKIEAGPKKKDFDEFIENLLGPLALAEATWFSAYRSGADLCGLPPAERSKLISQFIETADIGDVADSAKAKQMRNASRREFLETQNTEAFRVTTYADYGTPEIAIDHLVQIGKESEAQISEYGNVLDACDTEAESITSELEVIAPRIEAAQKAAAAAAKAEALKESMKRLEDEIKGIETDIREDPALQEKLKRIEAMKVLVEEQQIRVKYESDIVKHAHEIESLRKSLTDERERTVARISLMENDLKKYRQTAAGHDIEPKSVDDLKTVIQNDLPVVISAIQNVGRRKIELKTKLSLHGQITNQIIEATQETETVDSAPLILSHGKLTNRLRELSDIRRSAEVQKTERQREANATNTKIREIKNALEGIDLRRKEIVELSLEESRLETLREAFGRQGVQALLVESAVKPLEKIASDMIQEATDGEYDLRIETVKENKDGTMREEVSIIITDKHGERDIYRYSGGERRILSSIIRLALSQWVGARSGFRFGTVIVDEAFDSLDPEHTRQLTEAYERVVHNYDQIILITPDPVKAAGFADRITLNGS